MTRLGEMKETGNARYPQAWLTKRNGTYTVMLLAWDTEKGQAKGWMTAADGSLRHCRTYIRSLITGGC